MELFCPSALGIDQQYEIDVAFACIRAIGGFMLVWTQFIQLAAIQLTLQQLGLTSTPQKSTMGAKYISQPVVGLLWALAHLQMKAGKKWHTCKIFINFQRQVDSNFANLTPSQQWSQYYTINVINYNSPWNKTIFFGEPDGRNNSESYKNYFLK